MENFNLVDNNRINQNGAKSSSAISHSSVRNSKLTPDAKEFKPGSSGYYTGSDTSQGAIQKNKSNYSNGYYNWRSKPNQNDNLDYGRNNYRNTFNMNYYEGAKGANVSSSNSYNKYKRKGKKPNQFNSHHETFTFDYYESENSNQMLPDLRSLNLGPSEKFKISDEATEVKSKEYSSNKNKYFNKRDKTYYLENPHNSRRYQGREKNYNNFSDSTHSKNSYPSKYPSKSNKSYEKNDIKSKDSFKNHKSIVKKYDNISQRENLEQLIIKNMIECLVCYEKLKHRDKVWSCQQCYHILHLSCVQQWAESSKIDGGWRCPACQNICPEIPQNYVCYCGKITNPQYNGRNLPHSCDEVCGRKGRLCSHTCTLICHPGPCPDCNIMVTRSCCCGSTSAMVKCSSKLSIKCDASCNKLLSCQTHKCTKNCHEGECGTCQEKIRQECYCFKQCRVSSCSPDTWNEKFYSCGEECDKVLACGNHRCRDVCHKGECSPCPRSPSVIFTCPCGKKRLEDVRRSCLDPIPSCNQICQKSLKCGQTGARHTCKEGCHEGDCPPCPSTTTVRCRCGVKDKEVPCSMLTTRPDDARCQKKCTKKRSCGKHKCNQPCCIDIDHECPLPCNRPLSCGNHRCELTCHRGRCPPCWQSSFEELYCECGASVLMPPVPCGARPPICNEPCSRVRPCGHEQLHTCHPGPCPPCTVLVKTWCYGQHEQRSTILCHQGSFSCGLACGKMMPCGRHKCNKPCHLGGCPQPCKQPCSETRPGCGHPCSQPCHKPPCPEAPCRQIVKVSCQCGHRSASKVCLDLASDYQSITMAHLASKMEEIQRGEVVDISDLVVSKQKNGGIIKALECNEECRVIERNRRMAEALQITGSDFQQKIIPKYSDYMRQWAKKNPTFCQYVHNKLSELVQLSKQSKQKSRSYSFETMNKDKRHFVHEYCEHFGCESVAYDPEPNRNVVATALKDKSFVPSYSLLEVVQRENGQRKVPGPQQLEKGRSSVAQSVSLRIPGTVNRPPTPPGEYIDYFDYPPV